MKRNYFTLFMTVAFASMSFAQTNTAVEAKVEDHQFAYNILTNMSYEMGIGNKQHCAFQDLYQEVYYTVKHR
ncbi:hypothetical protein [Sphingobacterium siyangense]|uniref:hypothetical protein n=1 Tax=Sphingobacterium siyangense TaxID=459529 RepID=UPI001F05BEDC|nr:hypothetical protein [Sphingobacterium siyangense]